jgi:nicotinamide-nucleotide amidase
MWLLPTTGIAGPGGAVPGKPVGTGLLRLARGRQDLYERLVFKGDRQQVRAQTVEHSLKGLLKLLAD